MAPHEDFFACFALLAVALVLTFVVGYRAARRRERRAWLWAFLSWFGPGLLILLQLRHRDRPSIAPDWLSWVHRYSYLLIVLALWGLIELYNFHSIQPQDLRKWNWDIANAQKDATVWVGVTMLGMDLEADVYGTSIWVGGWEGVPANISGIASRHFWSLLAASFVMGLAVFRAQPWAALLIILLGAAMGFAADVLTSVVVIKQIESNPMRLHIPSLPASLISLLFYWTAIGIACWLLEDFDPDNPDADLTTAPPLPPDDDTVATM